MKKKTINEVLQQLPIDAVDSLLTPREPEMPERAEFTSPDLVVDPEEVIPAGFLLDASALDGLLAHAYARLQNVHPVVVFTGQVAINQVDFTGRLAVQSVVSGGVIFVPETLGNLPCFSDLRVAGSEGGWIKFIKEI